MGLFGKKSGDEDKGGKNKLKLSAEFNQSARQIFGLVLDVEKYPEFVEELESVTKTKNDKGMIAEFTISEKAVDHAKDKIRQKLGGIPMVPVSQIEKLVPKSQKFQVSWQEYDHITVENLDAPLTGVKSTWHFKAAANGGTHVEYETDYSNANFLVRRLLNMDMVQTFFNERSAETVEAIKKQADVIFKQSGGSPKGPSA